MFGAVIVFAVVVAIVATYILVVNRLLRSDENWSESNLVKPAVKAPALPRYEVAGAPAHA